MNLKNIQWISITQVIANIVTIAGLAVVIFQLHDARVAESTTLMFQINEHVRSGRSSQLIAAIDAGVPIFPPQGTFTTEEVDNYLMNWELLASAYDHHLVDADMLYDAFSYDIARAWQNKEIYQFILDARKEAKTPDLYGGVEELAKRFK